MGAMSIGLVLGAVLGAGISGEIGAVFGAALGMFVGGAAWAIAWMRGHLGSAPTLEHHRVMCTPFGHVAACEFEGDLATGRWYDVKRCSLLRPDVEVDCDKGCLRQLRLAGVRPGRPCDLERAAQG
jgi:hypothetical protein